VRAQAGNFVLTELNGPAERAAEVRDQLLRHDRIEVRDVTARFADRRPRLRLAVRLPEENARLIRALDAIAVHSPTAA
jgi:histidinol-phosphate/aromatic aminotransferase/cobyric acid decarboxylase-like protein